MKCLKSRVLSILTCFEFNYLVYPFDLIGLFNDLDQYWIILSISFMTETGILFFSCWICKFEQWSIGLCISVHWFEFIYFATVALVTILSMAQTLNLIYFMATFFLCSFLLFIHCGKLQCIQVFYSLCN